MKKLFIGIIVGFVLSFAASANADTIGSVVGKLIEGEFPVRIGDKQLENKAIIVNGTSYLPVREFGEATGYEVMFDANTGIALNKSNTREQSSAKNEKANKNYDAIIESKAVEAQALRASLTLIKTDDPRRPEIENAIAILESKIEQLKQEKAAAEAQK